MNIGKSRPGSHTDGWRSVPRIDRPASPRAWASASRPPIRTSCGSTRRRHAATPAAGLGPAGSLEATAGGLGEDVVEAGRVELHVLDLHAGVAQGPQRAGQRRRAAGQPDGDRAGRRRPVVAERLEHRAGLGLGVGRDGDDEGVGADGRLEHGRLALAHDPPAVDDGDPPRQLVGLLEVLGGEEHGGALAVEAPHLVPQGHPAGGVEPGGGLVEEQHGGLVHERQGQVEPAAHAAGVGADAPVGRRR